MELPATLQEAVVYFADPKNVQQLTPFRVTGRVQRSVWDSLGDYDLTAELPRIACPVIILHGREDPIPMASSQAAARAMLRAELQVLDGSGHVPYVEASEALFTAVRRFLAVSELVTSD